MLSTLSIALLFFSSPTSKDHEPFAEVVIGCVEMRAIEQTIADDFNCKTTIDSFGIGSFGRPLRKLHLVRPDLMAYPISYAVYC